MEYPPKNCFYRNCPLRPSSVVQSVSQVETRSNTSTFLSVEIVAYHNHGILVMAEEQFQDVDNGQSDMLVYGMRRIFFQLNIERIDVGKSRMIAGIVNRHDK